MLAKGVYIRACFQLAMVLLHELAHAVSGMRFPLSEILPGGGKAPDVNIGLSVPDDAVCQIAHLHKADPELRISWEEWCWGGLRVVSDLVRKFGKT